MIGEYLKDILNTLERGDAREESFYGAMAGLIDAFAVGSGRDTTQVTTLPKKTDAGNPDFRIWDGTQNIVGYIEAKKPGENLDLIENSEQLKRYRNTFPNLILTDFFEFRLYRNGELTEKTFVARSSLALVGITPPPENEAKFRTLLEKFFSFSLPIVRTSEELARELAKRTRFLRDEVITLEMEQQQAGRGELYGFYDTFKRFLIANLKEDDFADLFSQTITYGMFAARTRSTNGFNRKLAYDLIPKTIGILRNIFRFVSQGDLPRNMEVMIDDLADVLHVADVKSILQEYYRAGKGEDPIVHFYETFLAEYDPSTREKRGVYYTPEPVVRYIVRSVHEILKTHFDKEDGLASKGVTLLDPAGGTLTFPAEAIRLAVKEYSHKYGEGSIHQLISEQILPNYHAFELMMAPYAIGHIKVSFLLEELGYTMHENERFKLFLTNTLDMDDLQQTRIPGLESLSEESHQAGRIKKEKEILVIMGNPPYSANSANYNEWTEKLMKTDLDGAQSYYKVDGEKLREQNPKMLQDDYVKFLRFAQWKIQKAGHGIVGMITNHGYLSNVTFPGMRQSLMNTFNEIYIIDLHGDSQKKERAPDGSKDENVFDITKGTAISIFVKKPGARGCKVYHHDLYGLREAKYDWLDHQKFTKRSYTRLKPESPWHFFIKRDTKTIKHYTKWMGITEIFPVNSTGIKTHRDDFVIAFTKADLEARLRQFLDRRFSDDFFQTGYKIPDTTSFNFKKARKSLIEDKHGSEKLHPIAYRPFDHRHIVYDDFLIDRPRREVMQHMMKPNIGLNVVRQVKASEWQHALISDHITECCYVSNRTSEISYLFPLYLYPPAEEKRKRGGFQSMMVFEPEQEYGEGGKRPNIAPGVFNKLEKAFGQKPTPEQIMYYCYAILYSNTYRETYAEFLKIDFPRIPFTEDHQQFLKLASLGEELAQLHLLNSKVLNRPVVKYRGTGEDFIEKPVYDEKSQCVFINGTKYFEGVTPAVWEYQVGGYRVMEKYLKDRKGRQMTDPAIYCRIGTAIAATMEVQERIDGVVSF